MTGAFFFLLYALLVFCLPPLSFFPQYPYHGLVGGVIEFLHEDLDAVVVPSALYVVEVFEPIVEIAVALLCHLAVCHWQ